MFIPGHKIDELIAGFEAGTSARFGRPPAGKSSIYRHGWRIGKAARAGRVAPQHIATVRLISATRMSK